VCGSIERKLNLGRGRGEKSAVSEQETKVKRERARGRVWREYVFVFLMLNIQCNRGPEPLRFVMQEACSCFLWCKRLFLGPSNIQCNRGPQPLKLVFFLRVWKPNLIGSWYKRLSLGPSSKVCVILFLSFFGGEKPDRVTYDTRDCPEPERCYVWAYLLADACMF